MDSCIAALRKTVAAAEESARALDDANQRWEGERRGFQAERREWDRERHALLSGASNAERDVKTARADNKRLRGRVAQTMARVGRHLSCPNCGNCDCVADNGGRDSKRGKAGETGLTTAVHTARSLSALDGRRRTSDQPTNGHSSADEVATPTGSTGGQVWRRHLNNTREWCEATAGFSAMATMSAQGAKGGAGLEREQEGGTEVGRSRKMYTTKNAGRSKESTNGWMVDTKDQAVPGGKILDGGVERKTIPKGERSNGEDADAIEIIAYDGESTNLGEDRGQVGGSRGGDCVRSRGREPAPHVANVKSTDVLKRDRVDNLGDEKSYKGQIFSSGDGNPTTRAQHIRSPRSSRSSSCSSGRKRSRLELGEGSTKSAHGTRGAGKGDVGNGRTVIMEMPEIRRRSTGCRVREPHQQQQQHSEGFSVAAGNARSRLAQSKTPTTSPSIPGTLRTSSAQPDGSGGDGWNKRIESDSPPSAARPVGAFYKDPVELRPRAMGDIGKSSGGSSVGGGDNSNARRMESNRGAPRRTASSREALPPDTAQPLAASGGENRGIVAGGGGEGRGGNQAGEGGSEASVIYPKLTMAVVSPKKKPKRRQQRPRDNDTSSRSSSPAPQGRRLEGQRVVPRPTAERNESRVADSISGGGNRCDAVPNPCALGSGSGGGDGEQRLQQPYRFQEVVRDRAKRAAMKGHDCEQCTAYLAAVGGSPGERQAMLNMCSRHKHVEEHGRPAETPEGFWDLSFADSISRKEKQRPQPPRPGGEGQSALQSSFGF